MGQYYQKVLLKYLTPVIAASGIHRLTRRLYSGKGQILMLHRVIPPSDKERIHNHLSLEISPEHLENVILFFKKLHYDFIKTGDIAAWLTENRNNIRRFVVFTFDDGYSDNLTHALPVFKKYDVPFTIYITTSFPDKKAILWWYLLEEVILNNRSIRFAFPRKNGSLRCSTYAEKEFAFDTLRKYITGLNDPDPEPVLKGFFSNYGYDVRTYSDTFSLLWKEIEQLSDEALVTIGAHTVNHYNLRKLSGERSWFEIHESKNIIESHVIKPVNHFSYPLGLYGPRETGYVAKSGFLTATTTQTANVFDGHLAHLFELPRITINSLTTPDVLKLHINGFFHAVLNNFSRVALPANKSAINRLNKIQHS
jgi:peptidoglycan/xylan/chitin deacetylase (PgdA/CDA1 family)